MTKKYNNYKHGLRHHPLYQIWAGIKQRCYNKNSQYHHNYGGRGIAVCPEWVNAPKAFIEWCEANGYKNGLDIDRVNNDLGYSPENCRFVSRKVNNRNSRSAKWWWVEGVRYDSLSQAAKVFGVHLQTISNWCDGYSNRTCTYPPKLNCRSELKYN